MIEVNLIPGGKKKRRGGGGGGFKLSLPSVGGLSLDKFMIGAAAALILSLGGMAYLFLNVSGEMEDLGIEIEAQVEDSARFAAQIARTNSLTSRRDSILERIAVIQQIDQGRYTWAHIMDEVARALPDYTWLTGLTEISDFPEFELALDGRAGELTAVTLFMTQLEASPFLRGVRMINSTLSVEGAGTANQEEFYEFNLQLYYESPGPEFLETVPLFEEIVGPNTAVSGPAASSSGDVDQGGTD